MSTRMMLPIGPQPLPNSPLTWWVTSRGWLHLLHTETLEEWSIEMGRIPATMDLLVATVKGGIPRVSEEV